MECHKDTILLTGATGFLGSCLAFILWQKKYNLILLKRRVSKTTRIKKLIKEKRIKCYNIDKINLEQIFLKNKINYIIHAATSYGRAGEGLKEVKRANYYLPLDLLKLGIKYQVQAFINSDTFLNKQNDQSPKNHAYITTKKEFLKQAKKEIKKTDIKFANLIIEHMYGPDDNPTKIIPWLIKELLTDPKRLALNDGQQKRDFIYINDVCQAFLDSIKQLSKLNHYEDFGIGTGRTTSFKTLVKIIKKQAESNSMLGWREYPTDKRDCSYSKANTKNNKKIGWQPIYSLERGIKETLEYYKK